MSGASIGQALHDRFEAIRLAEIAHPIRGRFARRPTFS